MLIKPHPGRHQIFMGHCQLLSKLANLFWKTHIKIRAADRSGLPGDSEASLYHHPWSFVIVPDRREEGKARREYGLNVGLC